MHNTYSVGFVLTFVLLLTFSMDKCKASSENKEGDKEELVTAENRDGKLEIIKKIKKINNDGSYTIGYEADDGSFKIESRDVLGHIKGTYGFVDENGEIKRVSYTTSNTTEIITTQEPPTVVQRIPNRNRTTTKRPPFFSSSFSSTQSTPTSTTNSVVQSLARRRASSSTTTTSKPNRGDNQYDSPTFNKSNTITYTSAPPRVLVQGPPSIANKNHLRSKSEGQLVRPEVLTVGPTASQYVNPINLKNLDLEKPVHEEIEHEVRGNLLRRQLPSYNKNPNYNLREQLPHSLEYDGADVYTNSMSTAHPKPPLFTTSSRPGRLAVSTTPFPLSVSRPVVHYPEHYQSRSPQDFDQQQQSYSQETTTSGPSHRYQSATAIPVVQIPPNKPEESGHLVSFRHPTQGEAVLVPLSHFRGKLIPVDQVPAQYADQGQFYYQESPQNTRVTEIEQQKAIVRRLPSPTIRPVQAKVEETKYEQNVPQQVPIPYSYPVQVNTAPVHPQQPVSAYALEATTKYVETDIDNEIDHIQPPVSTRDFQKLLQQLILRQSRLEKVSMLTRQPNIIMYQPARPRALYSQQPPFFFQKTNSAHDPNSAIAVIHDPRVQIQRPLQRNVEQEHPRYQPQNLYIDQYDSQSFRPNRRVARLQPSLGSNQQTLDGEDKDEYLPPNVREMLLLRMLQLAINPALPVEENDIEIVSSPVKKKPVRNVEILGEEVEMGERSDRTKRHAFSLGVNKKLK